MPAREHLHENSTLGIIAGGILLHFVPMHHNLEVVNIGGRVAIHNGRVSAVIPTGSVTFLIGMRINQFHKFWRWMPVLAAMGRMLSELMRNPELGLKGRPRTFLSGRTILVWQQWTSYEALEEYSKSTNNAHLPAWRDFNKRSRGNASVGIYHETSILDPKTCEAVYVNMPAFGLAAAFGIEPAEDARRSASGRLGRKETSAPEGI